MGRWGQVQAAGEEDEEPHQVTMTAEHSAGSAGG